jgi:hypothetical protein
MQRYGTTASRNAQSTATMIGMASMGCLSPDGAKQCPMMGKSCNPSSAMNCMCAALGDYPEARNEITLAGLTMAARSAKSLSEIKVSVARIEMALQVHA